MSAHVLLNLLNKLEKSNKMHGLQSFFWLFPNKFNQLNNTASILMKIHQQNGLKPILELVPEIDKSSVYNKFGRNLGDE